MQRGVGEAGCGSSLPKALDPALTPFKPGGFTSWLVFYVLVDGRDHFRRCHRYTSVLG